MIPGSAILAGGSALPIKPHMPTKSEADPSMWARRVMRRLEPGAGSTLILPIKCLVGGVRLKDEQIAIQAGEIPRFRL